MAMRFAWDDLRYFLAVARQGTISGAAKRLRVNHATVMRRIDALEAALAAKLFERTLRGYGLTQRGERLIEFATRIESEAARVETELGESGDVSGAVRISSLEGFGNFFLAARLPAFRQTHPRLRIELLTIQQIVALSHREADIAITVNPPNSARFDRRRLTDYSLFLYGSAEYLKTHPVQERIDLASHQFFGYIDGMIFTRGLDYLDEVLSGLQPMLQSSSVHAQIEFACAGHGLCVLPSFIARERRELVPVLPDEISLTRTYWLVMAAAGEATPGARATGRFIEKAVLAERSLFTQSH